MNPRHCPRGCGQGQAQTQGCAQTQRSLDAGMSGHKDGQLQGCLAGSVRIPSTASCTSSGSQAGMTPSPPQPPWERHNTILCISAGSHAQGAGPLRKRGKHTCRAQENTEQKVPWLIPVTQSGNYT